MRTAVSMVGLAGAVVVAFTLALHAQIPPTQVTCLHGRQERATDAARREQAIAVLKAIGRAEGQSLQRSRQFAPLATFTGLPRTPDGFRLRLYLSDAGYVASLKDERDPCYFGLFSDESGFVYSDAPFNAPLVATANQRQ